MERLESSVEDIIELLKKKEVKQDKLLVLTRELIRSCSVAIKSIHANQINEARKELVKVDERMKEIKKLEQGFGNIVSQAYQEYTEVNVLLSIMKDNKVPGYKELNVPIEAYLTGLCDIIGELRRAMLEELRAGNKKKASYYFKYMNDVYEAMLPIKFSNSLLPNFKKKQDVARIQVENARSELL